MTITPLTPTRGDTVVTYCEKILLALLSGAGGSGAVMQYSGAGPPVATPSNEDNPAICYSADGTGDTYTWNTTLHIWM
jgi:hypothetical protein